MRKLKTTRQPYFRNWKLHPHEVINIYYLVNTADLPRQDIADQYDVSASHVSNIGKARFWRHLLPARRQ